MLTDPYHSRQLILPSSLGFSPLSFLESLRYNLPLWCGVRTCPWPQENTRSRGCRTHFRVGGPTLGWKPSRIYRAGEHEPVTANDRFSSDKTTERISISPRDNAAPLITSSCRRRDQFSNGQSPRFSFLSTNKKVHRANPPFRGKVRFPPTMCRPGSRP